MPEIIGVQFEMGGKIYYFAPNGTEFCVGNGVIVETAKGLEYGTVGIKNTVIEDGDIKGELKPAIRMATQDDIVCAKENVEKNKEAMRIFKEKIALHGLKMKAIVASYAFDRKKITFCFTADGRVDFRELVRDLAGELHTRIELRQIYEQEDMRMHGVVAACGRICCCVTHLDGANKVSVKMAKTQNLSLNFAKISGMCGKLMCCLKYENDFYGEILKRMPKVKSQIKTPDGIGIVEGQNLLRESVRVRIETGDGGVEVKDYSLSELEQVSN